MGSVSVREGVTVMGSLAQKIISATRPVTRLWSNDLHRAKGGQHNLLRQSGGLWAEFERRLSVEGISTLRTLLLGFDAKELDQTLYVFGLLDAGVTASIADLLTLRESDDLWEMFDVVMINHDAFEDPEMAVDEYLVFRERFAHKTVLLVSRHVAQDDLTTERAAICDATLRFPLSPERLLLGLKAGQSNRETRLAREERLAREAMQSYPRLTSHASGA